MMSASTSRSQVPGTASEPPDAAGEEETHLPLLRTWRGVYGCVLVSFVGFVVLLALLSWAFS